jgi:hypothetical protein
MVDDIGGIGATLLQAELAEPILNNDIRATRL